MGMTNNVKKIRGRLRLPNEFIAKRLGLPEGVEIIGVNYESETEIFDFALRSDVQVRDITYPTPEGGNIQEAIIDVYVGYLIEADKQIYEAIKSRKEKEEE